MKPLPTPGLRGRLILPLLAIFATLAVVFLWQSANQRADVIRSAKHALLDDARLIAARQQAIAARADAVLSGLMQRRALYPGASAAECSQVLVATAKQERRFLNIVLALPDGDVVCDARGTAQRVNVGDREFFQKVLRTDSLVASDVLTSRFTGRQTIVFSRALQDETGSARGVLAISLDLAWLRGELAANNLPEGTQLMVTDGRNAVAVHHPERQGAPSVDAAVTAHLEPAGKEEGVFEHAGTDGVRRLVAFTRLLDTVSGRMTLWLSVPEEVVLAPALRELTIDLAVVLTALIVATGLVFWGTDRLLVRPLLTLSRVANRFGAGEHAIRSGLPYTDDEVGRLARTLDNVADTLQSSEQKLTRTNRALRVLSAVNRALVRAGGEQKLVEATCRAIVEDGGYRIARVGYADDDRERSVRPVAVWGADEDFLNDLKISWGDTESGQGPTGKAIRSAVPVAVSNITTDPDYARWRERAQRYGYASTLALPLKIEGTVIGALTVHAAEPDAFDEQELRLLTEAADDLAFGIATRRAEAEHKRTQAALKTADERCRAAANASLDALFILECARGKRGEILDFIFTDLNPRAEELLGMKRGEVIGRRLRALCPAIWTRGFFNKFTAVVETGIPLEEEFSTNAAKISARWLRQQVVRVADGIAISARDVTAWKEMGTALRKSEEKFRLLAESLHDVIYRADPKTLGATYVNPAIENVYGYSVEEWLGDPTLWERSIHPKDRQRVLETLSATRNLLESGHTEYRIIRKDGTQRWVSDRFTWETDAHGAAISLNGVMHDITDRNTRERSLARANRALETLSTVNLELVRATDESQLLQAVCRIVVETGGYRMAWVGYADHNPEQTVTPAACAGIEKSCLAQFGLTWADIGPRLGPVGRAIRSAAPQITHDVLSDPAYIRCRNLAIERGYAANFTFPLAVDAKVIGALSIYAAESDAFDDEEIRLLTNLGNDLAFGIETLRIRAERDRISYQHAHHAEILQRSLEQSVQAIAATVEARDPYTAGHQRRVADLAVAIARKMGLPEDKIHGLHLASVVHDLGKVQIPTDILSKPGKLNVIEFMLIKTHPQVGYDILKDIEFPWPIAEIVRQHHEKLDGSGYPQGLKGEQILLEARIMAVADVVEAISSHRPYRAALGIEAALAEIRRGRGREYDPAVVDACLELFGKEHFAFQV